MTLSVVSFPDVASPEVAEGAIIGPFLEEVARNRAQLVGYNSAGADLPILVQRGIANGISCPLFCERPDKPWQGQDYFSRYSESHLDLAGILKGGGSGSAMPSLDEIAAACGIPGKLDHAGDGVLDLWLRGDFAALTGYNETDACTTYLLWLRTALYFGKITADSFQRESAAFCDLLKKSGKPHFQRFLAAWYERRRERAVAARSQDRTRITAAVHGPGENRPRPCTFPVSLDDLNSEIRAKLNRHLLPRKDGGFDLVRLGCDHEGLVVPGIARDGRPLLLSVLSPDLAGVVAAITTARIAGVDEWHDAA